MNARPLLPFALLLATACGGGAGGAFLPEHPDNRPDALRALATRLAEAPVTAEEDVVVALSGDELWLWDLAEGRLRWRVSSPDPGTAPLLAGDAVVTQEEDRVVVRRLSDGQRSAAFETGGLHLVGAAGEGDRVIVCLSNTNATSPRSNVLLLAAGTVVHRLPVAGLVGAPAVRGGLAFVPWGQQFVSVLDVVNAEEIARLRTLAGVVGHVRAERDGVFFGQRGVGQLQEGAGTDAGSVGWVEPTWGTLPGGAALWRDAYVPPARPDSAAQKIRLVWTPTAFRSGARAADGGAYLIFYRLVFGLSAQDGSVRWVRRHAVDIVGAAAGEGGLTLVDASGHLTRLSVDGELLAERNLEGEADVAVVRWAESSGPSVEAERRPPLIEQLFGVITDRDSRLLGAQRLALRTLGLRPEAEVTAWLIEVCGATVPSPLHQEVCETLAGRTTGAEPLRAALRSRASFLRGTGGASVEVLAPAALAMRERDSVGLLLDHLSRPETSELGVVRIAEAAGELGGADALERLGEYLRLYHAEPADEGQTAMLRAVAAAMLRLDRAVGRAAIEEVLAAPFTAPTTQLALQSLVDEAAAEEGRPPSDD